jgi:UDP-glucose 4-epimerase
VCNLGSGGGFSNREVIDTVAEVTGRPVAVRESARRPGDPATLIASNDRARERLGWQPQHDLAHMVSTAWQFRRSEQQT